MFLATVRSPRRSTLLEVQRAVKRQNAKPDAHMCSVFKDRNKDDEDDAALIVDDGDETARQSNLRDASKGGGIAAPPRGRDADLPWRRVATPPRPGRGHSEGPTRRYSEGPTRPNREERSLDGE